MRDHQETTGFGYQVPVTSSQKLKKINSLKHRHIARVVSTLELIFYTLIIIGFISRAFKRLKDSSRRREQNPDADTGEDVERALKDLGIVAILYLPKIILSICLIIAASPASVGFPFF